MVKSKNPIPGLSNLEPAAITLLKANSRKFELAKDTVIFHPGKSCTDFMWISSGCLRVQMVSAGGREIVLYRVAPGDTCIMTTSCLLSGDTYNAEAIVEENICGISISRSIFNELLATSPVFREMVFASFGKRIGELFDYIEEISFGRLDQRLASFICENSENNLILITHETLARELSTHREVVSRLLKEIERKGWVTLGHGKIRLENPDALKKMQHGEK